MLLILIGGIEMISIAIIMKEKCYLYWIFADCWRLVLSIWTFNIRLAIFFPFKVDYSAWIERYFVCNNTLGIHEQYHMITFLWVHSNLKISSLFSGHERLWLIGVPEVVNNQLCWVPKSRSLFSADLHDWTCFLW